MLLRSALAAAGMLLAATFHAIGQDSIPQGNIDINLDKATAQYKSMFEKTCYRQRHSLRKFETEPPTPEFEIIPRQYPHQEAGRKGTLLAEWGIFTRSGPYVVGLYSYDHSNDIITCVLYTVAMQKHTLKDVMPQIDGLYFAAEKEENETKTIGFMHEKELGLRVLCVMPIKEDVFSGECHLWSFEGNGS